MPFVTEELWHRLPGERDFVMRASWPELDGYEHPEAETEFARVMRAVEEIRSARKAAGAPDRGGQIELDSDEPGRAASLVATLARVEVVPALAAEGVPLAEIAARVAFPRAEAADGARQGAELARLRADLQRVEAKLANSQFRSKAPADVVAKEEQKAADLKAAIERLS
jgi:valyl-tRNA synthetase